MRSICIKLIFVFFVLTLNLIGQIPRPGNPFSIFDGTAEASIRFGKNENGLYMAYRPSIIRGLRTIDMFYIVLQDEDCQTTESLKLEIRKDNGEGLPGIKNSDVVWSLPLNISMGFGGGPASEVYLIKLINPITLPDIDKTYWIGLHFQYTQAWPHDGLSVHASGAGPTRNCEEAPRGMGYAKSELCAGIEFNSTGIKTGFWNNVGLKMVVYFKEPVLQGFAWNNGYSKKKGYYNFCKPGTSPGIPAKYAFANFGYAGIWPDVNDFLNEGRWDDFGWRVVANQFLGTDAYALLYISDSTFDPMWLNTGFGYLYVNPFTFSRILGPERLRWMDGNYGAMFGLSLGKQKDILRGYFVLRFGPLHAQALVFSLKLYNAPAWSNLFTMDFEWKGKEEFFLTPAKSSRLFNIKGNHKKATIHSVYGDVSVIILRNGVPITGKIPLLSGCTKSIYSLMNGDSIKILLGNGRKRSRVEIKIY